MYFCNIRRQAGGSVRNQNHVVASCKKKEHNAFIFGKGGRMTGDFNTPGPGMTA